MELFLTPEKTAVGNVFTRSIRPVPTLGMEGIPLIIGVLEEAQAQNDRQIWRSVDLTGWTGWTASLGELGVPIATATTFALDTNTLAVQDISTGAGPGYNTRIKLSLSPYIYDGTFGLTFSDGVDAYPMTPQPWDVTAANLKTALEANPAIGEGNVSVFRENDEFIYLTFIGALAGTIVSAPTPDATALRKVSTVEGILDARTTGVADLLDGVEDAVTYLEIEGTPPGGILRKLFKTQVRMIGPINPVTIP